MTKELLNRLRDESDKAECELLDAVLDVEEARRTYFRLEKRYLEAREQAAIARIAYLRSRGEESNGNSNT